MFRSLRTFSFFLLIAGFALSFMSPVAVFADDVVPTAPATPLTGGAIPTTPRSSGSAGVSSIQAGAQAAANQGRLGDYCQGQSLGQCVAVIAGGVINALLGLLGLILLGYLIYAGFLWMTSGGETDRAGEAITMIRNAVVGMFIIGSAFAISNFVLTKLASITTPAPVPVSAPPATP